MVADARGEEHSVPPGRSPGCSSCRSINDPWEARRAAPCALSAGAIAIDASSAEILTRFERFPSWVVCAIRPDTLWASSSAPADTATVRRGAFDRYAAHLQSPFAWVVVAEPILSQESKPVLDRLVSEILPLTRSEVGEAKRVELERKQARHRELSRAQIGGVWRVRVLVGGPNTRTAKATAAMLCAATELTGLPYTVAPSDQTLPFDAAFGVGAGTELGELAGPELVVALTRPPERELPGIRVVEPHTFDVNQEMPADPDLAGIGLLLGDIIDDAGMKAGTMELGRGTLNRHTFVCGATGAGKSQTVRHLLTEATRVGLPWLVIEPAKAEYARMSTRLSEAGGGVVVIRPGDPDSPPAGFNPLEPAPGLVLGAPGFSLQTHADLLRALFLAAFESHEPFPQILSTALTRCYEELGWDLTIGGPVHSGAKPRYPTLSDLQRVAARVVTDIGYGAEVAADVGGFIKVRLSSLRLGTTGRFFEGGHPLLFDRLRERNVVFEIEDVGDDADKAFLMGAVLMRLSEHLIVRNRLTPSHGLSHLTVIEEAHRLLRRPEGGSIGASAKAVEMFASLLAEVRAYGEGLIIAEQIPSKLVPDVIKNTAVKIIHRLPAQDDRESVGATMNLNQAQSRYVVSLTPGEGAAFTDGMDHPVLVRVPDGSETEKGELHTARLGNLIGRRSATCGEECLAKACTLREMRQAQHLLTEQPWLTIWAELTVLAHLAGEITPAVDLELVHVPDEILTSDRLFDCAVSHAIDRALHTRSGVLQPNTDWRDLANHCVASIRSVFNGDASEILCSRHGYEFLAARYRWAELLKTLEDLDPDEPRHPDSEEWERRLGRRLPGASIGAQRDTVNSWWNDVLADRIARDKITYGTSRPSVLETAIGGTVTDPTWPRNLELSLRPFRADWPDDHLSPPHTDNE